MTQEISGMSPYVQVLLSHLSDASIALLALAAFVLFARDLWRIVRRLLS